MRRFRFVGDPNIYMWDNKPIIGEVYNGNHKGYCEKDSFESEELQYWIDCFTNDWQEVTDEQTANGILDFGHVPKYDVNPTLHKDTDLGYYMLELLKIRMSNRIHPFSKFDDDVSDSIDKAKELIKQLDKEVGNG